MTHPILEDDNAKELKDLIVRIEDKRKDRKIVNEQISEIMAEAKSLGYDTKIIRKIVALREKDFADVLEEESLLETYKKAIGMV